MSDDPISRARIWTTARDAAQAAVMSEIESLILDRMEASGGDFARLARFKMALGEALGAVGTVKDILEMALAGYQAMTIQRRMVKRVAAAHGFGYWAFQHTGVHNPLNPPNAFLVMHRESDRNDSATGRTSGNLNFSSDSGLTSVDYNQIWRRGEQSSVDSMQRRVMDLARRGRLQPILRERLGPNVDLSRQNHQAIGNLFRISVMCPKLGSPSAAAGAFLLASLADVRGTQERVMNLNLYRQFPYNPRRAR